MALAEAKAALKARDYELALDLCNKVRVPVFQVRGIAYRSAGPTPAIQRHNLRPASGRRGSKRRQLLNGGSSCAGMSPHCARAGSTR